MYVQITGYEVALEFLFFLKSTKVSSPIKSYIKLHFLVLGVELRHFTAYIRHFPFYSNTNFTVLQSIFSFFPLYIFTEISFPFSTGLPILQFSRLNFVFSHFTALKRGGNTFGGKPERP